MHHIPPTQCGWSAIYGYAYAIAHLVMHTSLSSKTPLSAQHNSKHVSQNPNIASKYIHTSCTHYEHLSWRGISAEASISVLSKGQHKIAWKLTNEQTKLESTNWASCFRDGKYHCSSALYLMTLLKVISVGNDGTIVIYMCLQRINGVYITLPLTNEYSAYQWWII